MLTCSDCGKLLGKSAFGLTCRPCGVLVQRWMDSAVETTPLDMYDEAPPPPPPSEWPVVRIAVVVLAATSIISILYFVQLAFFASYVK